MLIQRSTVVGLVAGLTFVGTSHDARAAANPITTRIAYASDSALALDAAGKPAMPCAVWTRHYEIRIMHCNDPACSGGDESIPAHDSLTAAPSLALDSSGNPIVAYYRAPSQLFNHRLCSEVATLW